MAWPSLYNAEPDLLKDVPRRPLHVLGLGGIGDILATPHVHFGNGDGPRRAEPGLVAQVQDQEDGDGDVGDEEVRDVPFCGDEDVEAVCEGQEDHDDEREPCRVWL